MINSIFAILDTFENILWGYIGVPAIMLLGIYLTVQSRFIQIRKLPYIVKTFFSLLTFRSQGIGGVHPLRASFACLGGCVGVGNVVGICSAVQIGGPGALFWIWMTAIVGSLVKYAEVYLGLRYRIPNARGSYDGGPMYFIKQAVKSRWMPGLICLLLCVYGVEVYQFSIVTSSLSTNFGINQILVVGVMLFLVLFAGMGGVKRVGAIASAIIPFFVIIYVGMSAWVLFQNLPVLPEIFKNVFGAAFTGHAAMGGFIGSTILMTISQGVRRGCYTGDLGIGYASVIHSETSEKIPEKQASLTIFENFFDTFIICTSSVLLILVTDVWHEPIPTGMLVQTALGRYFSYMHLFMPLFLFILGYATINAYFCVGLKCAEYLGPRYGRRLYFIYAAVALFLFAFVDSTQAQNIMMIAGGLLLAFNCYGIFKLRKELSYELEAEEATEEQPLAAVPEA